MNRWFIEAKTQQCEVATVGELDEHGYRLTGAAVHTRVTWLFGRSTQR